MNAPPAVGNPTTTASTTWVGLAKWSNPQRPALAVVNPDLEAYRLDRYTHSGEPRTRPHSRPSSWALRPRSAVNQFPRSHGGAGYFIPRSNVSLHATPRPGTFV
jgi:hypothetical protein